MHRIHFCPGDRLFWPLPGAIDFAGPPEEWPAFLRGVIAGQGITDLVMFGDCRPLHVAAVTVARRLGLRAWVFEEGYARPNWITLEQGGTNACSTLPRDPRVYLDLASVCLERGNGEPVGGGMTRRICDEIRFHLANLSPLSRFPHWRTHRPYGFWHELFGGWLLRLARLPVMRRQADAAIADLPASGRCFYLFPLQVDADVQIRIHSPFGRMLPAIQTVLRSFAAHAPAEARLVVKNHPLDNGLIGYGAAIRRLGRELGLGRRVLFIDGGHLPTLLARGRGVVTVNSTVGLSAMIHRQPVKVLGRAVYDLPGLAFQGPLDAFWTEGEPPDRTLLQAFRRVVIARTQINGSFYTGHGIRLGVAEAVARLEGAEAGLAARAGGGATGRVAATSHPVP